MSLWRDQMIRAQEMTTPRRLAWWERSPVLLFLFYASSIGEAYFPDLIKLHRGTSSMEHTMLPFLCAALGNVFVGVLPCEKTLWEASWAKAMVPALSDILSQSLILGGIACAASSTPSSTPPASSGPRPSPAAS